MGVLVSEEFVNKVVEVKCELTSDWGMCDLGDDDEWCFTATFMHMVGSMGRATSNGNESKSKIPTLRFEHGW